MRILLLSLLLILFCLPLNSWVGCNQSVDFTLSGTAYNNVISGILCCPGVAQITCICKLLYTSSSGGSPSVNTLTVGYSVDVACAVGITELVQAGGVTGVDSDFGGAMRSTSGSNICVKESVGNSDKITITYAQARSF